MRQGYLKTSRLTSTLIAIIHGQPHPLASIINSNGSVNMISQNIFNLLALLPSWAIPGTIASSDDVKQIAIIGAGAAGSSAAYHLRRYADESGIPINVTVFEKTGRIGGRTLTVNVYDDPVEPIEVGASIFVDVNHILCNATRDFGLAVTDSDARDDRLLGIWDGDSFVYTQDSNSWDWVNFARLFWKYGTAPYYTYKLVQSTIATFLKLYEEPFFPFRSLSTRAFQLDLAKITGVTGQQFLAANNLDGAFAHDIVQASSRVNYASNLEFIHGLGTMVGMAASGAKTIEGGNWQIFANMIKASGADVRLNTAVTGIALDSKQRYKITTAQESAAGVSKKAQSHPVAFDDVIIATPFQFANISTDNNVVQHPIDTIPYTTLHVTLFASPYKFSPAFFKMPPASDVPTSVLTTLGANEEARPGQAGAGQAGFYSATLQRVVMNPRTHNPEYVYKIFTPSAVTADFLSRLLGVEIPESLMTNNDERNTEKDDSVVLPISWFHATVFHSYPQKYPRVTFQDPILGNGLYYTSGIESFISTMETSALMGMNVARLIVDDYAGITRVEKGDLGAMHAVPKQEEGEQNVLAQQQDKAAEHYGLPIQEVNEL
ncbi:prenylcysteine oxidase [Xylaria palmicola]|nr:prenylcysteine oxidase [Xylaria palmicola]